jgi:hypothetical protein
MHTATTHKVPEAKGDKLGELHIRMRNCKTPKMVEGRFVDYAVIHAAKRGLSQYPPNKYIHTKRGCGPPCGGAVTIVEECPYIGR